MEPTVNQNFEADFPIGVLIAGFVILMILSTALRRVLRKRHLINQGQLPFEKDRVPSIEDRVANNREWASGQIRSRGIAQVVCLWILAVVWNLTFGVSFLKSFSNPEMKTGGIVALGIFAVLGLVPIFFAIRFAIRQFRFGNSICKISGKAGVLGKTLAGRIYTTIDIKATGDYIIELQCTESYSTGSGKNRRTESRLHWEGKQVVPRAGHRSKSGIPFSIDLPKYPPETGCPLSRGRISWTLRMQVPVHGVDYCSMFVVPVFKVDYSE